VQRTFVIKYLVYSAVILITQPYLFNDSLIEHLNMVLAQSSAFIIHLFDNSMRLVGTALTVEGGSGVWVTKECSATDYVGLLCAGILAYSATWKQRLVAVISGALLLQSINVVRLVSLYFVMKWFPTHFDWVHENLWPMFFTLDMVMIFLGWGS